jgi:hypothetical protein
LRFESEFALSFCLFQTKQRLHLAVLVRKRFLPGSAASSSAPNCLNHFVLFSLIIFILSYFEKKASIDIRLVVFERLQTEEEATEPGRDLFLSRTAKPKCCSVRNKKIEKANSLLKREMAHCLNLSYFKMRQLL